MTVGQYLKTRFTELVPPKKAKSEGSLLQALGQISGRQWSFILVALCAWTWDSFDFFTVSLTTSELAETFDKTVHDITWGITLVLMLRPIGSIFFGVLSDIYGRKWPFILNNILFIVLELGTGFCKTYPQFLAVRALFGIAMGGLYGNAAATALEDCPHLARGMVSGLLQQGYSIGYLLAAAFARVFVGTTKHGWRPLFWFGACPPVLIIIWRLMLKETDAFKVQKVLRERKDSRMKSFVGEGKRAVKQQWLLCVYLVVMMACMNFTSHGTEDLYPTMLKNQFGFTADQVTVTQVVANLGATVGGISIGYWSQFIGRRLSILLMSVFGAALLYPFTYVQNPKVMGAAFFQQFCVQGAWGVVPIHLMELSPDSIRTFVVGTAYQLGTLAASGSSTIQAGWAETMILPSRPGSDTVRYDYARCICLFMAIVYAVLVVVILFGPEKCGRVFDEEQIMEEGKKEDPRITAVKESDISPSSSSTTHDDQVQHQP